MRKRILAAMLSLCMMLAFLPIWSAAADDLTSGTPGLQSAGDPVPLNIGNGGITFTSTGYQQGTANEPTCDGPYIVSGTSTETITVQSGAEVDLTISGLNLDAIDAPAIYIQAGATLNLTVEGENTLTGGAGFAAICVEPAYDGDWNYDAAGSAKLYISGGGSLTAEGGDGDAADTYGGGAGIGGNGQTIPDSPCVDFGSIAISSDFTGQLIANGGTASRSEFGGGAGIGGGGFNMYDSPWGNVVGSIEINGGSITAVGGDWYSSPYSGGAAGIGGGGGQGDRGTVTSNISITITGGTIDATGGTIGAGIGGGAICDGGTITITGGTAIAEAGPADGSIGAAGIGGGSDASVQSVTIRGGAQVTATASGGAAGIGGGTNTSYSDIHYGDTDGQVSSGKAGVISISGTGTSVYAYGGTGHGYSGDYGGAGIGAGYPYIYGNHSVAFNIFISDGASVRAYGGYHAQAIGYGYRPTDITGYGITLTLDDSIFLWAQNYDYYQPALVAATAYDNGRTPVSYSSDNGIYLTHYVDAEKEPANGAGSSKVPGYLNQPTASADETFDWAFDETTDTVTIGPVTVVDEVTGLNGNWATLCTVPPEEPVTISLADLIIYVGGDGYESVVTDQDGNPVKTESSGLPEPGFTVELPAAIDTALKNAAGHTSSDPLDLSDYLSFAYNDGAGTTRTWTLEHYDNKPGNTSMAGGRYIYRIVPALGQEPVRLQFTDENNNTTIYDEFVIDLTDQYQVYEMTIYPGALDPAHLQAVVTFPDNSVQTYDLEVDQADLIIRGVVDEGDPTTTIVTTPPRIPWTISRPKFRQTRCSTSTRARWK